MGLEYLLREKRSNVFNLGNGNGFSVKQLIEVARAVTGKDIAVKECDRRLGDPPILVASSEKAQRILGWHPQYPDLKDILSHAWAWHQQRHGVTPSVSVIIPAYNTERFIERTLHSVLNQTYKNIEVIVVDDGSQDGTAEIVKSVAQKDSRVTLLQQPNAGVAAARNLAIAHSTGEYIAPIDADDVWYPNNLEKQVQCLLQAKPSVGLVYSWSVDIDENDQLTGEVRASCIQGQVYSTLVLHDFIGNASCALIRRACIEQVGGYNCQLKKHQAQGGEDLELYLRLAEHYQFQVIPEFLVGYRKLSNSMSCDYRAMAKSRWLIWQSIQQKYPKIPIAIYRLSSSSFYMYLARQSSQYGNYKSTLFWLHKALRADFLTPFLRLGFYLLLITSLIKLMPQPLFPMEQKHFLLKFKPIKATATISTVSELEKQRMSRRVKAIVESILHQLIPVIFGTERHWK